MILNGRPIMHAHPVHISDVAVFFIMMHCEEYLDVVNKHNYGPVIGIIVQYAEYCDHWHLPYDKKYKLREKYQNGRGFNRFANKLQGCFCLNINQLLSISVLQSRHPEIIVTFGFLKKT